MTYLAEVDGRIIAIEGVPARVSLLTGERLYAPETVERIHAIVWGEVPPHARLTPVYEFSRPSLEGEDNDEKIHPDASVRPLRALVTVFVAAVLCVDLAAVEPAPRPGPGVLGPPSRRAGHFSAARPFPTRSRCRFPSRQSVRLPSRPSTVPAPEWASSRAFEVGVTRSTDRCLVIASGNRPRIGQDGRGRDRPGDLRGRGCKAADSTPGGCRGLLTS